MYKTFEELFEKQRKASPCRIIVACANDDHTIEAISIVAKEGLVEPTLIGDEEGIRLKAAKWGIENATIINEPNNVKAADKAAYLISKGEGDILLKGLVDTAIIMKAVLNKEYDLCKRGVLSHCTITQIPTYHKLIGITDCALLTYPDLDKKKEAIRNSVDFMHALGIEEVKVAALAAIEKVNPKMPETVDADELKKWGQAGELENCIIEGPISYDLAMKKGAAEIKGYKSDVAGDPDLLLVPNITAGNMLIKSLTCSAGAIGAGIVLGAKVPIVLTSRSTSVDGKVLSIRLALSTK